MIGALDAELSDDARRTFVHHRTYSILTGITSGVLVNAPTVGVKALRAADWQLALPTSLSGVGLVLSLALGIWMARRPKMPFILAPGFVSCGLCLGMAAATGPLAFLFLLGLFNLFETMTRPAMTALIRTNYPAEVRGLVTGNLRQWSAGAFLATALATARLFDATQSWPTIRAILTVAAALHLAAYAALARIKEAAVVDEPPDEVGEGAAASVGAASATLRNDRRFLLYLSGCFLYGVSSLSYDPVIRPYFSEELHLNYTQCVLLADVLPSLCSMLTIHRLGAWLDRTNPLRAWSVIRLTWGLDPILLALAPMLPFPLGVTAAVARLLRGSVMGGSWILWWQLGTNYFTRNRKMTSVYVGLHLTLNGAQRVVGPPLGALLGGLFSRREVMFAAGLMVLASAYMAWRQSELEKVDGRYPTFAEFERGPSTA